MQLRRAAQSFGAVVLAVMLTLVALPQQAAAEPANSDDKPTTCEGLQLSEEPPPADATRSDWKKWWTDDVGAEHVAALDEKRPLETTWLIIGECHPQQWNGYGIEFDDQQLRIIAELELMREYCCGAEGVRPESVEPMKVDGHSFPGFEIRGQRNDSGETTFRAGGETSVYVFVDRPVKTTVEDESEPLRATIKRDDDRLWRVEYDFATGTGYRRYNPSVGGPHAISVVQQGDYGASHRLHPVDQDPDQYGTLQDYHCRQTRSEVRTGDDAGDDDLVIRQSVNASSVEADGVWCMEAMIEDPDQWWKETVSVGTIEQRIRIEDDAVYVQVDEELDEFVDLDGEVQ